MILALIGAALLGVGIADASLGAVVIGCTLMYVGFALDTL
jgi:hypothetical protein